MAPRHDDIEIRSGARISGVATCLFRTADRDAAGIPAAGKKP